MDILLPKKDGWSVLKEMKGEAELKDLPVIVITAKPEDKRDRGYIRSYHLQVIRKPFDRDNLIETIALGMEAAEA
jgi:CheY-like chemotaxis protein